MSENKEMKIMFDFVIKRFELVDSFQKLKETIQTNFKLPNTDFLSKYRVLCLNPISNINVPITKEAEYKQFLHFIDANNFFLVKIFVEEKKEEEPLTKKENEWTVNKEKKSLPLKRYKKAGLSALRLKRDVKNLMLMTPSLKLKKRIRAKTKNYYPKKVSSKLRKTIRRSRTIKRGRKSKRQNDVIVSLFNNKIALLDTKVRGKSMKTFKKEKKFRYKNNVKSDDSKIEKWFLYARFNLRQYKKTEDKNSSYVITYEGKNKIKIQFRIRGPDKKFHCRGKLVNFVKEGYNEKWDTEEGVLRMENFLNYSLENFDLLDKKVYLDRF